MNESIRRKRKNLDAVEIVEVLNFRNLFGLCRVSRRF